MNRMLGILGLGLGIIILGFCLLTDVWPWTNTVWLNLFVSCVAFLVVFSNLSIVRSNITNFNMVIPNLGFFWVFNGAYAVLAIAAMVFCGYLELSFNIALLIQMVLGFGLAIESFMGSSAHMVQAEVEARETTGVQNLDQFRNALFSMQSSVDRLGKDFKAAKADFSRVQDDARYISSASTPASLELDRQLLTLIPLLDSLIQTGLSGAYPLAADSIGEKLREISELLRLRKEYRQ